MVAQGTSAVTVRDLRATFPAPPAEARPMVRWWWFGGSITEQDIDDQLASMARAGLGGVEAAFVYPLDPEQPTTFGSPRFLELVGYAAQRARELELRFDLTLGSGWSYGGAHIPGTYAAQRLRWEERAIGPAAGRVRLPGRWPGDLLVAAYLCSGAMPEHSRAYAALELDGDEVVVPAGVGPRTLLIATAGETGQQVKRASNGAEGPVLDHYSAEATRHHLATVGESLLRAAGPDNVTAVFCDSLEVYHSDWTPSLVEEFRVRRGYDPLPWLFHLHTGRAEGATFRTDFYRTLSELFERNFLSVVHDWAREQGVLFRVQNYGHPPARVSGYRHADLIEGEGWGWRGVPQTKWASSAAHQLGHAVVSSETWTWINSPSFRARPIDFAGEAHEQLLSGVNQFIGHGWPSSPSSAVDPGWTFYAAGAITDRNAWWPAAPALFRYLHRLCWVLRQGEQVVDVALWLPYEDVYAGFGPGEELNLWRRSSLLLEDIPSSLREAGYDFDVIDAQTPVESVLRRHQVVVVSASRLSGDDSARLEEIADTLPVVVVDHDVLPEARHVGVHDLVAAVREVVSPDVVVGDSAVGVVHRRLDDGELYFVANTGPERRSVQLETREVFTRWERWDAHDGSTVAGEGPIRLELAPYAAAVVLTSVVNEAAGADGAAEIADPSVVPTDAVAGMPIRLVDWEFIGPDGERRSVSAPHVWEDEALDGFVGTATYVTTVSLSGELPTWLVLDASRLPVPARTARRPQAYQAHAAEPLGAVAEVRVNGEYAGVLWAHPFQIVIGHLLGNGTNTIEIAVSSTSVAGMRSPEWRRVYTEAEAAHGRRFVMQEIDLAYEPIRSGLLVVPELR